MRTRDFLRPAKAAVFIFTCFCTRSGGILPAHTRIPARPAHMLAHTQRAHSSAKRRGAVRGGLMGGLEAPCTHTCTQACACAILFHRAFSPAARPAYPPPAPRPRPGATRQMRTNTWPIARTLHAPTPPHTPLAPCARSSRHGLDHVRCFELRNKF